MSEYNHQEFLRPISHTDDDLMLTFLSEISAQNPNTIDIYKSTHDQYVSVRTTDNYIHPTASDTEVNTYSQTGETINTTACLVVNLEYHLSDDYHTMTKVINIEQDLGAKRIVLELGRRSAWLELNDDGHITEYSLERIN